MVGERIVGTKTIIINDDIFADCISRASGDGGITITDATDVELQLHLLVNAVVDFFFSMTSSFPLPVEIK